MPMLAPSQTTRGLAWLTNFAPADQPAARLLIDSLQIASASDVLFGIKQQIQDLEFSLVNHDGERATGMLIPASSQEDIHSGLAALAHHATGTGSTAGGTRGRQVPHVAWKTYPAGMPISVTPGSEGLVGNAARDFTGDRPGHEPSCWLHPATSLETLASRRCRMIVLVTDNSGSGKQVIEFARTFTRHERIRSWRSLGWVKIVVVAHAMSLQARAAIDASKCIDDVRVATPGSSFADAAWTEAERAEIERVCKTYTPRKKAAFGFGGSAGLFLSHTSVPNNLPYILRRTGGSWKPLFDGPRGRNFPPQLAAELGKYQPLERDLGKIAEDARQQRVARAIDSGRLRTPADRLVVILALLSSKPHTAVDLSHRLAVPEGQVQAMLTFLSESGFVDQGGRVTPAGRKELAHARRLDRTSTARLTGSSDPYYPQALR